MMVNRTLPVHRANGPVLHEVRIIEDFQARPLSQWVESDG
jgi:hypothetical protein